MFSNNKVFRGYVTFAFGFVWIVALKGNEVGILLALISFVTGGRFIYLGKKEQKAAEQKKLSGQ